jgi:predicted nucleic acid-binding protein
VSEQAEQSGPDGQTGTGVVVVDAAVVTKLILPEELSARAQAFCEAALRAGRRLVAPPTVPVEVATALLQRRRADEITGGEADAAFAAFLDLGIDLPTPVGLHRVAYAVARAHRLRSAQPAVAVALAQLLETELWTGDRVLMKTLGSDVSWVRWIGDADV